MSNISIPEPCHENWAEFTSTEKGAFCGSCQIDVVDFSNKSPEEVKNILKKNAGKHLCGRFRKSQLDELNNEFSAWENQSVKSFQSKFLYACLIVFGMSLFTSCNVSEQNFLQDLGIEWTDNNDEAHLQITKPAAVEQDKDTTKKDKNHYRKGKIKYVPEETQEDKKSVELILGKPMINQPENNEEIPPDSLDKSSILEQDENCAIKGNVIYDDIRLGQVIATEDSTKDVSNEESLYNDQMVDGGIMWTPEFEDFVEDTTASEESTPDTSLIEDRHIKGEILLIEPFQEEPLPLDVVRDSLSSEKIEPIELNIPQFEMVFDAQLFPNPVQDQTRLVINVKDSQIFNVYLYAINGKMVKDIYNGMLATGRQELVVDLTGYESGSYLIVINAGKQKESLMLEKLH